MNKMTNPFRFLLMTTSALLLGATGCGASAAEDHEDVSEENVGAAHQASTTTCGKVMSTTFSGNTVTVQLGNVNCDGSDITVSVAGVNGASGSVDASATMTLQVADVNGDGVVDTADINEIRMNIGRGLVNDGNFRTDITVDGKCNHGDKTLAKTKL